MNAKIRERYKLKFSFKCSLITELQIYQSIIINCDCLRFEQNEKLKKYINTLLWNINKIIAILKSKPWQNNRHVWFAILKKYNNQNFKIIKRVEILQYIIYITKYTCDV